MTTDHFAHKASSYEQNESRVGNVTTIGAAVLEAVDFEPSMHIVDFGAGTGLLLEQIAPHVGKITAIDTSAAMIRELEQKRSRLGCALDILQVNLEETEIPLQVDGLVSSMTMHHVQDIPGMFRKFHAMVKPGGFIAIADLDSEDGSFHTEDTGVFHHGFDRDELARIATDTGFQSVKIESASEVQKPQGRYSVFLLTAQREPNS